MDYYKKIKMEKWWFSIGRDCGDYRAGDIVVYRNKEYRVIDRFYDRVELDNGVGASRYSDELRLTDRSIEQFKERMKR